MAPTNYTNKHKLKQIMKKYIRILLMLLFVPLLLSFNCGETNSKDNKVSGNAERKQDSTKKDSGLQKLVKAYPDFLEKGEDNK